MYTTQAYSVRYEGGIQPAPLPPYTKTKYIFWEDFFMGCGSCSRPPVLNTPLTIHIYMCHFEKHVLPFSPRPINISIIFKKTLNQTEGSFWYFNIYICSCINNVYYCTIYKLSNTQSNKSLNIIYSRGTYC